MVLLFLIKGIHFSSGGKDLIEIYAMPVDFKETINLSNKWFHITTL